MKKQTLYDVYKKQTAEAFNMPTVKMVADGDIITHLKSIKQKDMVLSDAIKIFTRALKKDKEYRYSWLANIAMAFKDRCYQYKEENKKKSLSNEDIHVVANEAAEYFLKLICDEIKYPEGR